ncbi:hypothetical protein M758_UG043800 [Ceratodon purpureus]|nr:hypothetical protein M758_UG043800 [Ceratodon purpureus]
MSISLLSGLFLGSKGLSCNYNSSSFLTDVKSSTLQEQNPHLSIDCNDVGTNDMQEQNVFETLVGKKQQVLLATQVMKMILKIDDVINPSAL